MTLNESISDVRTHLMEPHKEKPGERQCLLKLQDVAQLLHLEAINTSTAWEIRSIPFSVSPNQSNYLLNAADLSKDVRVITTDLTNPYHETREIRRCDLQDIDQYYRGPERSVTGKHSAEVMAFYRQGGSVYVKVFPTPAQVSDYEIWYEADLPDTLGLGDSPNIRAFHRYRNIEAAIALIPFCEWGFSEEKTQRTMQNLALSLGRQATGFEKAWRRYITSDRQDGTTVRIGYGEGSYDYF